MSIVFGGTVQRIVFNGVEYTQAWFNGALIWSAQVLRDDFNRDDAATLGAQWTSTGTGPYKLGIVTNSARVVIPDGLISQDVVTDRARFNVAQQAADDYLLEFRIGSPGSNDNWLGTKHRTQVFARGSNGGTTDGVGPDLYAGQVSIVRRKASVDTTMLACGAYAAGDIGIMRGVGNLHSLYINGEFRGEWNDSGATANKGAGYRSLIIRSDGSKDLLGPRRFSAQLDYVQLS